MSAGVPPGASAKPLARLGLVASGGELRRRRRSSGERERAAGERRLRRAGECGRARGGRSRPRPASALSPLRAVTGHRSLAHLLGTTQHVQAGMQHSGASKCAGRARPTQAHVMDLSLLQLLTFGNLHARRRNGVHWHSCRQ